MSHHCFGMSCFGHCFRGPDLSPKRTMAIQKLGTKSSTFCKRYIPMHPQIWVLFRTKPYKTIDIGAGWSQVGTRLEPVLRRDSADFQGSAVASGAVSARWRLEGVGRWRWSWWNQKQLGMKTYEEGRGFLGTVTGAFPNSCNFTRKSVFFLRPSPRRRVFCNGSARVFCDGSVSSISGAE